jgi:hypothetical protein
MAAPSSQMALENGGMLCNMTPQKTKKHWKCQEAEKRACNERCNCEISKALNLGFRVYPSLQNEIQIIDYQAFQGILH